MRRPSGHLVPIIQLKIKANSLGLADRLRASRASRGVGFGPEMIKA